VARPPADDEQALTHRVIESPLDDTVRLVLADWFDEHPRSQSDATVRNSSVAKSGEQEKPGQGRTGLG
jgi:uncharacterized protein (TIGR02996 family)